MISILNKNLLSARSGPTWFTQAWWGGEPLAARQYTLLQILAVGQRERLDIAPLIASLATEHRGYYRSLLSALALRIEAGATLVGALEQTPDALSDEDVLALRLAGESGTWTQTFNELLKLRLEDQRAARMRPKLSAAYWLVLLFVCYMLITLLMHVVAPTFIVLGREMNAEIPRAYLALILLVHYNNLGWLMLISVIMVIWFTWFRAPGRFFQRQVAPQILPPVAQQQIVELYRMLAVAVEAGRPITGALSTLARYHFNRRLRQRLLYARNEIEQGADVWQGLAQSRLINAGEAEALSKAPNNRVAAWTLRELAQKKFVVASRRTATLATLVEPMLTLLFGGLVLWVCIAFFQFLVAFIVSI